MSNHVGELPLCHNNFDSKIYHNVCLFFVIEMLHFPAKVLNMCIESSAHETSGSVKLESIEY